MYHYALIYIEGLQMSKYDPLREHLARQAASHLPMSFDEVERVLGFALPPSAKVHATWWSNNTGTHVGVRAWRDAGWKTANVNVPGEKVTFVRDLSAADASASASETIVVRKSDLHSGVLNLIARNREAHGGTESEAVVRLLEEAVVAARRRLLERFPMTGEPSPIDSTDIIRAARDAR
jgi:hypothetical protein